MRSGSKNVKFRNYWIYYHLEIGCYDYKILYAHSMVKLAITQMYIMKKLKHTDNKKYHKKTTGYETRDSGSTKQPENNEQNGKNKSLSVIALNESGLNSLIKWHRTAELD